MVGGEAAPAAPDKSDLRTTVARETPAASIAVADIADGVWRAFDRSIEETKGTFSGVVAPEDLLPFLDALQDAVRCVVVGMQPRPPLVPPSISTTQVLEYVRRSFVDAVHSEKATDAQQAIHILSALGHVQMLLDVNAPEQMPDLLAGRDAASLLIEIAHDMRSPLAAILFLLDMLRTERSGPVSNLQQQQLRLIYGASLGIMQLACDLIDSVRGPAHLVGDRGSIEFSIAEIFWSLKDIVLPMAEEKGVQVEFVLPSEDRRLGLPAVLSRILLNLTSNAIKFTNAGVVTVSAVQMTGNAVEFAVQDSGREIPTQVMEQLFRPFRRSEARRAKTFSSAGLGLSICHKLTLALGSELRVTTTPKQGTRFHFLIDLPIPGDPGIGDGLRA
ncbi:MAG TPA: HAMP domain-containing sensor histidine kinase [Gemmatimonadaceae bacterium]|nr:HAMP domain-containing sensor histidine kinase [Gemmatimonadaceae bacterium]